MRKGYVALVLGLLASACGGGEEAVQPPQTPPAPPVAEAPKPAAPVAEAPKPAKPTQGELQAATAKALAEAFNAHDAKKFAALYTDDASLSVPGYPVQNGEFKGRAEIEKSAQVWFDGFKDLKFWFSRVWVKGETAAFEWGWSGTHSGEFLGLKPTEKQAGLVGLSVVTFDQEGHVKKESRYYDGVTIMTQLGAAKGKARPVPTPVASPEVVVAKGTPEEDKNVEVEKALTAAFESKKEADFLGPLAEDIEYNDMTSPEPSKGKAEGKKFFGMFTKAFPDAKHTAGVMFGAGDFVVHESSMAGTHKGPLGPIAATKKPVTTHNVDVLQFKDGKVAKGWSFSNSAELLMQLGVLKAPGAAPALKGEKAAPAAGASGAASAKGTAAAAPAAGGAKAGTGGGGGAGTGGGSGGGTGGGTGAKPAAKAEPAKK
jgi:predicted ester cyclase